MEPASGGQARGALTGKAVSDHPEASLGSRLVRETRSDALCANTGHRGRVGVRTRVLGGKADLWVTLNTGPRKDELVDHAPIFFDMDWRDARFPSRGGRTRLPTRVAWVMDHSSVGRSIHGSDHTRPGSRNFRDRRDSLHSWVSEPSRNSWDPTQRFVQRFLAWHSPACCIRCFREDPH